MLKHVVFLKFKKGAPQAAHEEIKKGLGELPDIIPEIMEFLFGRDVLRSERSYHFALVSEFENIEAMQRDPGAPVGSLEGSGERKELCEKLSRR